QNQMGLHISPDTGWDGIKIDHIDNEGTVAINDLWFYGSESGGCIGFRIRYNADLYKRETIEKLRSDLLGICKAVTDDPAIDLATLTSSLSGGFTDDQMLMMANKDISENF
ncbi:MAG TPA: hypothetical protein VL978_11355, partial [Puia sp.]|nr:hypothetical protein [Puia sp.]